MAAPSRALDALAELSVRSAAPDAVRVALRRLGDERPADLERLVVAGGPSDLGRAFVAVVAASDSLGRLLVAEPGALDALARLDDAPDLAGRGPDDLARGYRLAFLRIAARDLLGLDPMPAVGAALAELAATTLDVALAAAAAEGHGRSAPACAVIGMGKLGGAERNYASDVDVLFVVDGDDGDVVARRTLRIAGRCFRVDADLRPEGRAGPLTRTLDGYRAYWERWADAWEFQALLKGRAVAGNGELGRRFDAAAAERVWGRGLGADELAALRAMKARAEAEVARRGMAGRDLKRGPGGIRDIEFAVQLLQLVHGPHDEGLRDKSTLGALRALRDADYVGAGDADRLARAYEFLRTVEHRLQLVEEEQTHALPSDGAGLERLARTLGYEEDAALTATARLDADLRDHRAVARSIHERLFFRPLLEAFAALDGEPGRVMASPAVAQRLAAFGFPDAARTRAAVEDLAGGLSRSSRLMDQLLPLLLDWLSSSPDPDLGLQGLRTLAGAGVRRRLLVTTFRESPEAARRLCLLLGSSRALSEAVQRNPELIARLGDDAALVPTPLAELAADAADGLRRGGGGERLVRIRQEQLVRIAMRDLLDLDDVDVTGAAMSAVMEALLQAALDEPAPGAPLAVIGMGRFGGGELSYASDLDVLLVRADDGPAAAAAGDAAAEALLRLFHGAAPSRRVAALDLGLRPEGGQGTLTRSLAGYERYFARYGQTWERQALLRARPVAGDADLGAAFMALVDELVGSTPAGDAEVAEIRRMKARVERERIPAREDPQFHLKLGRGSLSDVEWTVQLLQLTHRITAPATMGALDALRAAGALAAEDAEALSASYRFCERTRNRWWLVGALPGGESPGDALPTQPDQLSHLARSLHTTPGALRDRYRRVTRRARRVVERVFYGMGG